jgi:hypothetical protein
MTEQIGHGNAAEPVTIAGNLLVSGSVAVNGTTSVPATPTINVASVSVTTEADAVINDILLALKNLGFIASDAA